MPRRVSSQDIAVKAPASDIAENVLASMQKPFRLGDTIEVNGHTGVVQRVTSRGTVLLDTVRCAQARRLARDGAGVHHGLPVARSAESRRPAGPPDNLPARRR